MHLFLVKVIMRCLLISQYILFHSAFPIKMSSKLHCLKFKAVAVACFIITILYLGILNNDEILPYNGFAVYNNVDLAISINEDIPHLLTTKQSSDQVIFTFFSTSKLDPQRNKFMPATFRYMNNFYVSAKMLNLNVIIFHDNLTEKFVHNYTTEKIKFQKITMDKELSINDYRFVVYHDWLKSKKYTQILIADIADVVFWGNPFDYMDEQKHHKLFVSLDIGTFQSNRWMLHHFKRCYGQHFKDLNHLTYSPGLWGGTIDIVQCMLNCIVSQLHYLNHTKLHFNCNMPVLNWCIIKSNCIKGEILDDNPIFANPYRRECESKYIVVHDKCVSSKGKCIVVENGTLVRKMCNISYA